MIEVVIMLVIIIFLIYILKLIKRPKVCFITAIFGNYETTCKKFVVQTIDTDFICFTDNKNMETNGWIIDNTPYHVDFKNELDDDSFINSISNNKHTFNIAKYYKQSFYKVPRLQDYDVVIWIDGTVEIVNDKTSEYIISHIYKEKIIGWHHEYRGGSLQLEVDDSMIGNKYTSTNWNGQDQPFQDVGKQYESYLEDGYTDSFFKDRDKSENFGVWITCFVAFLHKDAQVRDFLETWYLQTLKHTTQDQVSFSYTCYKTNLLPMTLPKGDITGKPHISTSFYIKNVHGT